MPPLKSTPEQVIERWMLTIVRDGGISRFDDLHIDQINDKWKDRRLWVSAGLEAYKTCVALRDQHRLPHLVTLSFSLEPRSETLEPEFRTTAKLLEELDWSPPSLYLFKADETPWESSSATGAVVQELPLGLLGDGVPTKRVYRLKFRSENSDEYCESLFVEG